MTHYDFLLHLPLRGCIILKFKSSGRKYASISCASVTDVKPAACVNTRKKCAMLWGVSSCNGCRFGLRNGAYCNAKRAILESKTAHIGSRFGHFQTLKLRFLRRGLWYLTTQTLPFYPDCEFQSPCFLYNIVYRIYDGETGGQPESPHGISTVPLWLKQFIRPREVQCLYRHGTFRCVIVSFQTDFFPVIAV